MGNKRDKKLETCHEVRSVVITKNHRGRRKVVGRCLYLGWILRKVCSRKDECVVRDYSVPCLTYSVNIVVNEVSCTTFHRSTHSYVHLS